MSNTQVHTSLAGFFGPFFTRELHELHQKLYHYKSRNFSGLAIIHAFEPSPRYQYLGFATTDDQYRWPQAITFAAYETTIKILLPFAFDMERKDGTLSDRHSALYTQDVVSPLCIRHLLVEVNRLWDQYLSLPTST